MRIILFLGIGVFVTLGFCQNAPMKETIQAILITGGDEKDGKTAEIYLPKDNSSCTLSYSAELPEGRRQHTQDGGLACGGGGDSTETSCVKWSQGSWIPSHSLRERRFNHLSWATASGVYLMGGHQGLKGKNTSELVKKDGTVVEGFQLRYDKDTTPNACAIPDPDKEVVIITGGVYQGTGRVRNTVAVYNEAGWQRDLAPLSNQGRSSHACSSFTHDGEKHLIVTGGFVGPKSTGGVDTTEVYSYKDNAWTETGKLPTQNYGMTATTINNRVLLFGGIDYQSFYTTNSRNIILEYDPESKEWTQIGTMLERRSGHAVSVVDYNDFAEFCEVYDAVRERQKELLKELKSLKIQLQKVEQEKNQEIERLSIEINKVENELNTTYQMN